MISIENEYTSTSFELNRIEMGKEIMKSSFGYDNLIYWHIQNANKVKCDFYGNEEEAQAWNNDTGKFKGWIRNAQLAK